MRINLRLLIASTFILLGSVNVSASSDLLSDMAGRIEEAKNALHATNQSINAEKRAYAEKQTRLESEIAKLRKKTAGIQREADEKLLSLQHLQERLGKWQDQRDYQNHLLQRHVELLKDAALVDVSRDLTNAEILSLSLQKFEESLNPRWRLSQIALPSGDIAEAQAVAFGPAKWFYAPDFGASGMYIEEDAAQLKSAYLFNGSSHQQVQALADLGSGRPYFDATQGRALEIEQHKETFWDHIQQGGVWVLPIVFFGTVALVIALLKSVQLSRLSKPSPAKLLKLDQLLNDDSDKARQRASSLFRRDHAYQRMVDIVLGHPASQKRDDLLYSHLTEQRRKVDKYLDLIALTAAVAPLLGLLGTVSGMIKTFKMLTIFGSGDPAAVSGGISEALITTELGLVVAIPALVINAFLSRRAKAYMQDLEETAINLNARD